MELESELDDARTAPVASGGGTGDASTAAHMPAAAAATAGNTTTDTRKMAELERKLGEQSEFNGLLYFNDSILKLHTKI